MIAVSPWLDELCEARHQRLFLAGEDGAEVEEEAVVGVDTVAERAKRGIGRPSLGRPSMNHSTIDLGIP